MSFTAGPWDGSPWAEAEWRTFHRAVGNRLLEIGSISRSTSDRTITWSGAVAFIEGTLAVQSGSDVIDIPVPASGNKRIDWLCLEYDPAGNTVALVNVGAEGVNPSPPDLVQDEEGIWQEPVFRVGPYGAGPIASAPADDYRIYASRVRSASTGAAGYGHGNERGDVLFTPEQVYWHDGSTFVPYLNVRKPEVFSTSDSGWPRARTDGAATTNQLTVPARDYDRVLQVSGLHYLAMTEPTSANYNSWMSIDDSNVAYWRHPRDWEHSTASTATLTATYTLPAKRSVRIRLGFDRVEASGAHASSSSNRNSNRIDVLAVPA